MHPVKAVGDDSEVISIEVGAEVIDINVIAQERNIEWKRKRTRKGKLQGINV